MNPLNGDYLGTVLFIGLFIAGYIILVSSKKYRLPTPLLLFMLGLLSKTFLPSIDIKPLVVIALALLLFDAGSRFIPKHFDSHAIMIVEFIIYSIIVNSIVFGLILHFVLFRQLSVASVLISLFFGVVMSAVSQFDALKIFKVRHSRLYYLSETEDHLSNPIALVLGLILISIVIQVKNLGSFQTFLTIGGSLFIDIAVGIFVGLIMLYIAVKIFRRRFFSVPSIAAALLSYFIAVAYQGNGFIAVIISSLFFHNAFSKIPEMDEFGPIVNNLIYIFVFVAMGYLSLANMNLVFVSLLLFFIYIIIRHLLLHATIKKTQGFFMTFDCPKGMAIGALALYLLLIVNDTPIISEIEYLVFALFFIVIYSILLSYITHLVKKDILRS